MPLDPNSSEPPYRQLAALLSRRIESGEYAPGQALPSGSELAKEAGVSRVTVQSALKVLKADGLVVGRQGSGVFVRTVPSRLELAMVGKLQAHALQPGPLSIDTYGRTLDDLISWIASGATGSLAGRSRISVRAIVAPFGEAASHPGFEGMLDSTHSDDDPEDQHLARMAKRVVDAAAAAGVSTASAEVVSCALAPDLMFDLLATEGQEAPGERLGELQRWFDQEWRAITQLIAQREDDAQVAWADGRGEI